MGILLFLAFSLIVTIAYVWLQSRGRSFAVDEWPAIVSRLQPIAFEGLKRVALDHLQPSGRQLQLEPDTIWDLIGGWDGLHRMQRNADLIIQLAAYVQLWNHDEAIIVAERIRQDALMLRRALLRAQLHRLRFYRLRAPFYVHQAAAAYYLMTRRLLTLYETSQYVLYPQLAAAL